MGFLVEIFNHSEVKTHKTYICSKASTFNVTVIFLSLSLPLVFLAYSRDFWITNKTYLYIPRVKFQNQVILRVAFENEIKYWSNIAQWKTLFINQNTFINCDLSYKEIRSFINGVILGASLDQGLDLNISFSLASLPKVLGIQVIFTMEYLISESFDFKTEALGYFDKLHPVAGKQLSGFGRLKMYQKQVLPYYGHVTGVNNTLTSGQTDLYKILENHLKQNYTVSIDEESKLYSWTPLGSSSATQFNVVLRVRYQPQKIRYANSMWNTLKFAWLQYVAVAFVSFLFFSRVRYYVFSRRLFATVQLDPQPIT